MNTRMKILRKKQAGIKQNEDKKNAFFQKEGGIRKKSDDTKFFQPTPHQNTEEKVAFEANQVNQQTRPKIQLQVKPPGNAGDYLPEEGELEGKVGDSPEQRRVFIVKFLTEIYPVYKELEEEKILYQIMGVSDHTSKKETLDKVAPIPSSPAMQFEGADVKTEYGDKGARIELDPFSDYENGINMLEEFHQYKKGEIGEEYNDIKIEDFIINAKATIKKDTADAIMELRKISNVLNRVYSAYKVSQDEQVGLSLPEVLALYRQEGNMDIPSSMESIKSGIPTGKYDSASIVGTSPAPEDKIEMSHMVLILNKNHGLGMGSDAVIKLRALKLYINHLAGLDVIHKQGNIDGLAKWSVNNLIDAEKIEESEKAKAIEDYKIIWTAQVENIEVKRKGDGIIVAPKNPTMLVSGALKEASIFLERYQQEDRVFGEEKSKNVPEELPLPLAYMQFNSSKIANLDRPKVLIKSALRNAKNSTSDRFDILRTELKALGTNVGNFDEIKKWLLGQAPYEVSGANNRWDLTMDFMEHAGKKDWGNNWAKIRGNASLLRSQVEFYDVAFDEEERNWLKGLDLLNKDIQNVKDEFFNQTKIEELTSQWENQLKNEAEDFKINVSRIDNNWVVTLVLNDKEQEIGRLKNVPKAPDPILNISKSGTKEEAYFNAQNVTYEYLLQELQMISPRTKEPLVLTSPLRDQFGYIKALPFHFKSGSSHGNAILTHDPVMMNNNLQNALQPLWAGNKMDRVYDIKMSTTYHKNLKNGSVTALLKTLHLKVGELEYQDEKFKASDYNEVLNLQFPYESYQINSDYLNLNTISRQHLLWLNLDENFVDLFLKIRQQQNGGFRRMRQIERKMKKNHKLLEIGSENWFNETALNQSLAFLENSLNQGIVVLENQ